MRFIPHSFLKTPLWLFITYVLAPRDSIILSSLISPMFTLFFTYIGMYTLHSQTCCEYFCWCFFFFFFFCVCIFFLLWLILLQEVSPYISVWWIHPYLSRTSWDVIFSVKPSSGLSSFFPHPLFKTVGGNSSKIVLSTMNCNYLIFISLLLA